jgi:hypothetical protein
MLDQNFKKIFKNTMDQIIGSNGALTVPCKLLYSSSLSSVNICNNCIIDPISKISTSKYNGSGPISFAEGSLCPVCNGRGVLSIETKEETINMAVLFDSKYWYNLNNNTKLINIANSAIQTISSIDTISKIRNANSLIVNTALAQYGSGRYERAGDPEPCGLGDHEYIFTMWKNK